MIKKLNVNWYLKAFLLLRWRMHEKLNVNLYLKSFLLLRRRKHEKLKVNLHLKAFLLLQWRMHANISKLLHIVRRFYSDMVKQNSFYGNNINQNLNYMCMVNILQYIAEKNGEDLQNTNGKGICMTVVSFQLHYNYFLCIYH